MKRLITTISLTIAALLGSAGVSYALPPCPSDPDETYDNCFGTHTFGPSSEWAGDKYVGEWMNNKKSI